MSIEEARSLFDGDTDVLRYDALNCGEVQIGRLRRAVDAVPLALWDDGRIRLACDVSNWLRPDAESEAFALGVIFAELPVRPVPEH
ncbi:MAG: hypothetical protein J2P17_36150, partial [Mycobacterium sp.]|nr:hypothetical protein [Mycobacterium sp.]